MTRQLQSKFNGRLLAVLAVTGLFVAVACEADDDDAGQPTAGNATRAGSKATAGTSGHAGAGDVVAGGSSGGAGGTSTPAHSGAPGDCSEHHSVSSCEAAGCIAETGTLSERLGDGGATNGGASGAGGTLNRGACTTTEGLFISCEEGYGGAMVSNRCSQDCHACIEGGWTLPMFPGFPRQDCVFACVDGEVQ